MRLYKLIGLEIEALMKEHEKTLANIAEYNEILSNRAAMAKVIIRELEAYKKEYGRPRRTVIDNLKEAVVEEKKIEEMDVVFLMDRFGYAKTIDVAAYERNREAADAENRYVPVSYTHLRAHETEADRVCRLLLEKIFFLMIRRPPRSTPLYSSAASDVYKRQACVLRSARRMPS